MSQKTEDKKTASSSQEEKVTSSSQKPVEKDVEQPIDGMFTLQYGSDPNHKTGF